MPTITGPDSPVDAERRKKTFYLLLGGIASLLVPALWLLYGKLNEMPEMSAAGLAGNDIFRKRGTDGSSTVKITPAASQAPPSNYMPGALTSAASVAPSSTAASGRVESTQQDSMAFIRGGQDYQEKQAPPPPPPPAPAKAPPPAPAAPAPAPTVQAKAAPPAKKPFTMPKLQGWKGFGGFGGSKASQQQQLTPQQAAQMQKAMQPQQQGAGGGLGAPGVLKAGHTGAMPQGGVPPGAAGLVPGGAGGAGMPDVGALMKNLPPGMQLPGGGQLPAATGGGMPDMSQLMKNLPPQKTGGQPMPGLGDGQTQQGQQTP